MTRSERGTDIPQPGSSAPWSFGTSLPATYSPIKVMRFLYETEAGVMLVGIAPSLLGPEGLLFLICPLRENSLD